MPVLGFLSSFCLQRRQVLYVHILKDFYKMSGFRNERILCWLLRRSRHVGKSVANNRRWTMDCHSYRYGGGLKLIAFILESDKMH